VSADEGGVFANGEAAWNIGSLVSGVEKNLHVTVQVAAAPVGGLSLTNTVFVNANEIGQQSGSAVINVSARTPGSILFTDAIGNTVHSYHTGDSVCVQVTDYDRNENALLAETVGVVLNHRMSGDRENVTLAETDVNTGVFRGCIPSTADPAVSGDGKISVTLDSGLNATYTDPLDAAPVVSADVLIDPFGVVFDSMTGHRISGAVVTLIDADTGLPATIAKLPLQARSRSDSLRPADTTSL
jgi:hypothetical protein